MLVGICIRDATGVNSRRGRANAALDGIRVLDLSTGIAGPMAAMFLADFGADVVKVEPPSGDPARALPGFAVWNRNKRGIVIDSANPADQSRLDELMAGADVCVTSAVGHGSVPHAEEIAARYPGMVVLHTPPYTPSETPWAGGAESNGLLCALGGPACRQSSFEKRVTSPHLTFTCAQVSLRRPLVEITPPPA
ncbi:MAG: hypothetical protein NVSMB20_18360 [Bradyrhizobium sp.]